MTKPLSETLNVVPVIPVIVVDDTDEALNLAKALVKGGLSVLEVTLRTPGAMDAIDAVIKEVEGAIVGAGTVITPSQLEAVNNIGCQFAVSPGFTKTLLDAAQDNPCPLLPGASTTAEAMQLLDAGYRLQKFFPAEPSGGVPYLKSLQSPLPQISFCPTGGVGLHNAKSYLSLKNVVCVGGSWVAPSDLVKAGNYDQITQLAQEAVTSLKQDQ